MRTAPATGSLVVVFNPTTSVAEVQRILRSAGARIVDGPTQANAYVLEVPPGQTERAAQAIRAERAALLIEPLGPPARSMKSTRYFDPRVALLVRGRLRANGSPGDRGR